VLIELSNLGAYTDVEVHVNLNIPTTTLSTVGDFATIGLARTSIDGWPTAASSGTIMRVPTVAITTQPAANTPVIVGSISGSLTVAASVSPTGAPTFQWYSNTTNSNTGGTPIPGARDASFTIPTGLAVGTHHFYVVVSAAPGAAPVVSNVAVVTVGAAPIITINTQPAAATTVVEGSISGSLSVAASATQGATPTFQWYSNTTNSNTGGTAISGATSASFPIPTGLTPGTYYFYVVVSATGASSVTSNVAVVTVNAPPPAITITTQPSSPTVMEGTISGNLSVAASVTQGGTPTFQWYSNTTNSNTGGTVIDGAISASFPIPTGLPVGTHYFYVVVSATGASSVTSNVAVVTVNAAPVITINIQPAAAITVTQGNINSVLSVAASVTQGGTPTFQWYSNTTNSNTGGTAIGGATSANFAVPTGLAVGTHYFYVVVSATNAASVTSAVAIVTVNAPTPVISITTQPSSPTVTEGGISGSLSVAATVTLGGTPTFQWYSNTTNSNTGGTAIGGATSANFAIPTGLAVGTHYFYVVVSATGATTVRSNVAVVTVNALTPVISVTTQPSSPTVTEGSISGSLSVAATVTLGGTPSFQWYSSTTNSNTGGTAISGATSASFTIPTALTAGTHYFYVVVSATGASAVTSNVAVVTVNALTPVISITTQPSNAFVTEGSISGSLNVVATVTEGGTPTFQWYSSTTNSNAGGTAVGGATDASFTIPTGLAEGIHYFYVVVSAAGASSVTSDVAVVTVTGAAGAPVISITTQPADATVTEGGISGELSVTANVTEGATLSYQWYSNTTNSTVGGMAIAGATNAEFAIPTALTTGTHYFYVVVSATGGATSVTSDVAVVTVETAAVYSISLTPGNHLFPAQEVGYPAQTPFEVTVTNTGNQPTGLLTVASSDPSFTVTPTSIVNIAVGETATFTIMPNDGLGEGTYTTTVTVSSTNPELETESFSASFTVAAVVHSLTFAAGTGGELEAVYAGNLLTSPASVADGQNIVFTATPDAGWELDEWIINGTADPVMTGDSYSFVITGDTTVEVSFVQLLTEITLSTTGTHAFPEVTLSAGTYIQPAAHSVTVTNVGTLPTGALAVTLSGANPAAFTLDLASLTELAPGETTTFTVRPNANLASGTHTAIVTVDGAYVETAVTFTVSFTVRTQPSGGGSGGGTRPPTPTPTPTPPPEIPPEEYPPLAEFPFEDSEDHWARDAIEFVYRNNIMDGTGATTFAPNGVLSRAMVVRILWNLEGQPAVSYRPIFTDLPAGQWFSEAVVWAYDNDIVEGFGDGTFRPSDNLTREQFAAVLHRYAEMKGYDLTVPADFDLRNFADYAEVSEWALEVMLWANYHGLITGRTATTIDAGGSATRAEAATILMRFVETFAD